MVMIPMIPTASSKTGVSYCPHCLQAATMGWCRHKPGHCYQIVDFQDQQAECLQLIQTASQMVLHSSSPVRSGISCYSAVTIDFRLA